MMFMLQISAFVRTLNIEYPGVSENKITWVLEYVCKYITSRD